MNTWVTWLMLLALSFGIAESQSDPRALLMGLVDRLTGNPSEGSAAPLANEGNDAIEEDKRDADAKVPAPVPPGVPPAVQPITIPLPIPPPLPPLPPPIQLPVPPQLLPNTITATKTLYAEVTKRITRHPVCMTVYGVKPPCLPVILHAGHHPCPHYDPSCYKNDDIAKEEKELLWDDEPQEGFYIQPTASLRIPPATTAFDLVENVEERTEEAELQPSRESRYLEFRKPTPTPPSVPVAVHDQEAASDTNPRLINFGPTTQTVTKTLWVTKVQKVIDYRVTATLEAKNCVPTDLKLPFCQPPTPPPHKPPHYKPTPPPHYGKPPHKPPPSYQPQPAYQPEPPKPGYQPEPPKPSYQPEPPPLSYQPPKPGYQPEPPPPSYQPPKPAYQPELPQPGYFPEPPSYYVEPLLPGYQPEPPHLGYKPPVPPPVHWKEGEEEKKTDSPAETNDEATSESPEEGST